MGKAEQRLPLGSRPPAPVKSEGSRNVDREAVAFQSDVVALEERPLPPAARSTIYIIAFLTVTAFIWASLSQVDRIVTARGKLMTVDPLMVVQPLETGIIRSINVTVGDSVKAGQTMAVLDPAFSEFAESANSDRILGMEAEIDRIEAELADKEFPVKPEAQYDNSYLSLQVQIFRHRRAEFRASLAASDADAARIDAALVTNRSTQQGLAERIAILREVETIRQDLYDKSIGSRVTLLQANLERYSLRDQMAERSNQEKELLQQLASVQQQKEKFINNWVRENGERLAKLRGDLSQVKQQFQTAQRRRSLVTLQAPADGIVLEMGQRWVGSVVKEAEPLVTLISRDAKIEAEIEINAADIGRLRVGDIVRLKLDALPFQRHGTLSGRLRVITENSFQPDKGDPGSEARPAFYRGRVTIDTPNLRNVPDDFRLIPGMVVAAEMAVGKRTIISYVFDPIIRTLDEGLREP